MNETSRSIGRRRIEDSSRWLSSNGENKSHPEDMKSNHRRRQTGMDPLEGSRGREVSTEGGGERAGRRTGTHQGHDKKGCRRKVGMRSIG